MEQSRFQYVYDHRNLKLLPVPKKEAEALDPEREGYELCQWREAIHKEASQFDLYNTFDVADQVGHAMKTKLVFTLTYH